MEGGIYNTSVFRIFGIEMSEFKLNELRPQIARVNVIISLSCN
jgi:hypothetical protein